MKKSIRPILLGGAILFALSMSLTSCNGALEDILGVQDNPAPETPTSVAVTSITLNKTYASLLIGGTETLTVDAVAPADATDKTVTWSSDNTDAATVDENTGAISGVAAGTATITATAKDGSGVTATCTVYVGLLSGKFTINAIGDQIQFAQGNLQAKTDNLGVDDWTWTFATNQWDYIGNEPANNRVNGFGTVSANGTVDLFGWVGESNTTWSGDLGSQGNAAMHGICYDGDGTSNFATSTDNYGVGEENLKSDWGTTIGTGWRTLTKAEWEWLLGPNPPSPAPNPGTNCRTSSTVNGTDNARFTQATINTDGTEVHGLILFPDGVTIANEEATNWGTINGWSNWGTMCTTAQWAALAAKGCVFMPAAGHRYLSAVSAVSVEGRYWSSTSSSGSTAISSHYIRFKSNGGDFSGGQGNRSNGVSVRLVVKVPAP